MRKWNFTKSASILPNRGYYYYKEFEIQIRPNPDSRTETYRDTDSFTVSYMAIQQPETLVSFTMSLKGLIHLIGIKITG